MKKVMRALAMCAALAIMLPGCLKEKREATLNADGSGRVVYEAHLPLMDMSGGGTGKEDTARQARKEAAKILENSDGVDAWKDVSFEVDKDGLLAFKGTAYFRDLNKLSLHGSTNTNMRLAWRAEGDGAQLELVTRDDKKPHAEPAKLSDAEIAQRATDAKNKFKQQLPMFAAMLAEYRSEWSVALPGAPEKTVNFEKVASAPNTVRIVYDGPKMLEALNKLPGDEAFWKEQAASGADFAKDGPQGNALNEKLFGTRGPIQTFVRAPLKNQFDYAAEMAAAKAGFAAMKARLKLDETSALPPPCRRRGDHAPARRGRAARDRDRQRQRHSPVPAREGLWRFSGRRTSRLGALREGGGIEDRRGGQRR